MSGVLPVVLAISPKSTRLGVAVFQGEFLCYYELTNLWSSNQPDLHQIVEKKLNDLINEYKPTFLATENLIYPQQKTTSLTHLRESIGKVSADQNLRLISHSPKEVRLHFSRNGTVSKRMTATMIVDSYPELSRYLFGQSKRQELYGMPIFDAVALGLYCVRKSS